MMLPCSQNIMTDHNSHFRCLAAASHSKRPSHARAIMDSVSVQCWQKNQPGTGAQV